VYGLSLAAAGYLTALFIFPASLLRPLGGWLSDRYGPRRVTYVVFLTMAVSLALLSVPASVIDLGVWGFTILMFVVGCGMGIGKASVFKYVPDYFPRDVGAVGGLVGMLGALGGFVLPPAFGALGRWAGSPQAAFAALLVLTLVSLAWLHAVVVRLKAAKRLAAAATPNRETVPAST
jgi:NNP family nitrate/nitrite transporter-like MFS transporter